MALLPWILGIVLHLSACITLTWKAGRWSRKHPLGADASEELLKDALSAAFTSTGVLLLGLIGCGIPLCKALARHSFLEAGLCSAGLAFVSLAALPCWPSVSHSGVRRISWPCSAVSQSSLPASSAPPAFIS